MAKNKDWVCFDTPALDKSDKSAFKALTKGEASPYQQQRVLEVIVADLARTHSTTLIPGAPDQTAFLQGRAFVGQRILKILSQPVDGLAPNEEGKSNG